MSATIQSLEKVVDNLRLNLAESMINGASRHSLMMQLQDQGVSHENATLLLDQAEELVQDYRNTAEGKRALRDRAMQDLLIGAGILVVTVIFMMLAFPNGDSGAFVGRFMVLALGLLGSGLFVVKGCVSLLPSR